jgi:hypothetical protein
LLQSTQTDLAVVGHRHRHRGADGGGVVAGELAIASLGDADLGAGRGRFGYFDLKK